MTGSLCALVLCLSFGGGSPAGGDAWIGEDKWRHFFASFAATTIAAAGARALGAERETALYVGVGTGAAVGIGKEIRDLYHPEGNPSWRDLAWDAAGVGAGAWAISRSR